VFFLVLVPNSRWDDRPTDRWVYCTTQGLESEEQAHQTLQLAHNRLRTELQSEITVRETLPEGGFL